MNHNIDRQTMPGIAYDQFLYLWPPRPEVTIKPYSEHFEAMKKRNTWRAQLKMNGQRNDIYISPDREVIWRNRHASKHLSWHAPQWLTDQVLEYVGLQSGWVVLDGELLHCKDKTIKNTLYIWDILAYDGIYLIGSTYQERYNALFSILNPVINEDAGVALVTDNIWMAINIGPDQYDSMWARTSLSYVEGFVFKDMQGKLKPCIAQKNNSAWQVRCRKAREGVYRF